MHRQKIGFKFASTSTALLLAALFWWAGSAHAQVYCQSGRFCTLSQPGDTSPPDSEPPDTPPDTGSSPTEPTTTPPTEGAPPDISSSTAPTSTPSTAPGSGSTPSNNGSGGGSTGGSSGGGSGALGSGGSSTGQTGTVSFTDPPLLGASFISELIAESGQQGAAYITEVPTTGVGSYSGTAAGGSATQLGASQTEQLKPSGIAPPRTTPAAMSKPPLEIPMLVGGASVVVLIGAVIYGRVAYKKSPNIVIDPETRDTFS